MSHKDQEKMLSQQIMDYLDGEMNSVELQAFETLLENNPELSQEVIELQLMMAKVNDYQNVVIPEPSTHMDLAFYQMLDTENKANSKHKFWWQRLLSSQAFYPIKKIGYALSLVAIGVFVGHYTQLLNQQTMLQEQQLELKNQQIQALTVLSLLDMPSANKRIMAVNLVGRTDQPDPMLFDALLDTLKSDQNTNVRLETLEVLAKHAENNHVRTGLVEAINYQKSPMLQIAIAQLMQGLQEKQAVAPLQEMLNKADLMQPVREHVETTINDLI